MKYNLQDLRGVVRSWARGVAFYAPRWNPSTGDPLNLTHLGDTEGDIGIALNGELATMTLPEVTGPAVHEADFTGENPVVDLPLYLAAPALLAVVSPAGSASGGRSSRQAPVEYTLVLFPEDLFITADVGGQQTRKELKFENGVWTVDGKALTAAQATMLDQAIWFWRGAFNRPPRTFKGGAGNERKNIEKATFQVMDHPDMPEGHHLYTTGDPADAGIDIEGGS
jgi:hypothetical protein